MAGSLSMATTAASSAKVAVVDSGEDGRSAVYSRYNSGPRTQLLGYAHIKYKLDLVGEQEVRWEGGGNIYTFLQK
jgi:hypothetical protein